MTSAKPPLTLDHAGIAARIPHQGRMCLLDQLDHWTETSIECRALSHRDENNPLRTDSGLLAPCAIEYAAQAMALHGALSAGDDAAPSAGFLASVRSVKFSGVRLDQAAAPLRVQARHIAGDGHQRQYDFVVSDAHHGVLAAGRATVVLNTALQAPSAFGAASL